MISTSAATLCALVLGIVNAQAADKGALSGSIDGAGIPDLEINIPTERVVQRFLYEHYRAPSTAEDEQEMQAIKSKLVCSYLQGAVERASRERQKRELGISVSQAEIDAARQEAMANSADALASWTWMRDRAAHLALALSAVYDQGRDAGDVFHEMVEPQGINEGLWAQYLYTGRSLEGRAKLTSVPTLETVEKAQAAYDAKPLAEGTKLDAVVDETIARTDPIFRGYLHEWRTRLGDLDSKKRWVPTEHKQYLDQERANWQKSQVSKLSVFLNDPSLIARCGLPSLGVRVSDQ